MKRLKSHHGVICRLPKKPLGYFGWPSIARSEDNTLIVVSSGLRALHVCPWGKTVLHISKDNGKSWTDSIVVNDTPIDDRDAGIISLGGERLLISWFTSDTREYNPHTWELNLKPWQYGIHDKILKEINSWTDDRVYKYLGSWIRVSENGQEWDKPIRVPVTAPHGPIRLSDGNLLYFGKSVSSGKAYHTDLKYGKIISANSKDNGRTWNIIGELPIPKGTAFESFHEPHIVELTSGKIIGIIRYQHSGSMKKHDDFSLFQTESYDGGETWSTARPTGVYGSPPHLLKHSSGAIICVYGYRRKPYGERAMLSYDEGITWKSNYIIRDDAPDSDLGYPASVELEDGSIFTIYYQKYAKGENCSLLWSRWKLP